MKKIIIMALAAIAFLQLQGQDFSKFEAKSVTKDGHTLVYRILWPEKMKKGEKYPIVLFMHGLGKRGTDNEQQLDRGADIWLKAENRAKYPCIVIYPQTPKEFFEVVNDGTVETGSFSAWTKTTDKSKVSIRLSPYGQMTYDVVQDLIKSGVADTDRLYIGGSSMGGFSTFQFITMYPDMWAAAIPIASSTDVSTIGKWAGKIPVWMINGENDKPETVANNKLLREKMKQMGIGEDYFKYTIYPGVGHGSWGKAFQEPDFIPYLFRHTKKK